MFELRLSRDARKRLESEISDVLNDSYRYNYNKEWVFEKYPAIDELIDLFEKKLLQAHGNDGG